MPPKSEHSNAVSPQPCDYMAFVAGAILVLANPQIFTSRVARCCVLLSFSAGLLTKKLPCIVAYPVSICFVQPGMGLSAVILFISRGNFHEAYFDVMALCVAAAAIALVWIERYRSKIVADPIFDGTGRFKSEICSNLIAVARLAILLMPLAAWFILGIWTAFDNSFSFSSQFIALPAYIVLEMYGAFTTTALIPVLGLTLLCSPLARYIACRIAPVRTTQREVFDFTKLHRKK